MKHKMLSILFVTMLFASLAAGCAPTPAPTQPAAVTVAPAATEAPAASEAPAAAPKVLKVGVLAPFTGPSARVGEEFKGRGHDGVRSDQLDGRRLRRSNRYGSMANPIQKRPLGLTKLPLPAMGSRLVC